MDEPFGSEGGYRRPVVVIQNDAINATPTRTFIVCPVTSNLRAARFPGNVPLAAGEANLPKPSVVQVHLVATADFAQLDERIGILSPARVRQILDGLRLLTEPVLR
jgi:mRNA interferase MazF